MVNPYLFPTPPDLRNLFPREYIQMPDSLSGPWVVCPSVVLTEPPLDGSLIITEMAHCYVGSCPTLIADICSHLSVIIAFSRERRSAFRACI